MPAIRVSLAFRRYPAPELVNFAFKVFTEMSGNPHFPSPPFSLSELKTDYEALEIAIIAAKDGGKSLVASKVAQQIRVVDGLRELAAYVQLTARGNSTIVYSAGFMLASNNTAPSPLARPSLYGITNPASTKLGLKVTPVRNARVYEVWVHTGDGNWRLAQTFQNTRRMILENLTPGTLYWLRVRAVGGSTGFSDWSDAVEHMSI